VWLKETNASKPLMTCRNVFYRRQNRDLDFCPASKGWGEPADCPTDVRHEGGVTLRRAFDRSSGSGPAFSSSVSGAVRLARGPVCLGQSSVNSWGAKFAMDSPLEGAGFEPSIPLHDRGRIVVWSPIGADRDPTLQANSTPKSKTCSRRAIAGHICLIARGGTEEPLFG
jgi:hypothetical protein